MVVTATDRESAGWLAEEVRRAGGRLSLAASTLLALFLAEAWDSDTLERIASALADAELVAEPPLDGANVPARDGQVLLRLAQERRPEPTRDEPASPPAAAATPAPGPTPAEIVAAQASALPAAALTAGAVVPGLVLAVAGLSSWWLFGVLFALLAGGVFTLGRVARIWLARTFLLPLRSTWAAGFLLTALPLLLLSATVGAVVVAPAAGARAENEREDRARTRLASADAALRRGDLDAARRDLAKARDLDGDLRGVERVTSGIEAEQRRRDQERVRRARYDEGREALRRGDYRNAMQIFEALAGYRDADALRADATRRLAARQLRDAREALQAGKFERALALATTSLGTHRTAAGVRVQQRASRKLSAQRARARAAARARARARAIARRRAAERRRQARLEREAERERQEQLDVAPDPGPDAPGAFCENGQPTPEFPGQRDGDGDGCYGES